MSILFNLLILVVSSVVLIKVTTVIIDSLGKLSNFFALREFSASFILMAIATSLPELFVGATSALEGASVLSLGNVLGSNIVNLTLVAGVVVIVSRGVTARSIIVRRDAFYMAFYAAIPLVLLYDKVLSKYDGLILIAFYVLYLIKMLRQKSVYKSRNNHVNAKQAISSLITFLVAILFLLASAEMLVRSAKSIAIDFKVPLGLVGLLFISLGTSLPEIVFELKAVNKGHSGLALGDLVGSVVANSTLVLGTTALINPVEVASLEIFLIPLAYLFAVFVAFEVFVRTDKKLIVWEGFFLLMIYVAFLLTELGFEYWVGH